jgi:hypothetical protein
MGILVCVRALGREGCDFSGETHLEGSEFGSQSCLCFYLFIYLFIFCSQVEHFTCKIKVGIRRIPGHSHDLEPTLCCRTPVS